MAEHKFKPKKLFRPYREPKGFVMPKPGQVKPSRPSRDKRQLSLFDPPRRLAGDYIAAPLSPELATQLLAQSADRLDQEERQALFAIERGQKLDPQQRETLNGILAKLGEPS
jgi:hypothetical protein